MIIHLAKTAKTLTLIYKVLFTSALIGTFIVGVIKLKRDGK